MKTIVCMFFSGMERRKYLPIIQNKYSIIQRKIFKIKTKNKTLQICIGDEAIKTSQRRRTFPLKDDSCVMRVSLFVRRNARRMILLINFKAKLFANIENFIYLICYLSTKEL